MKKILSLTLLHLLFVLNCYSQTPQWNWAQKAGGNYQEGINPQVIQTDSLGNVYIMCYYQSSSIKFGSITLTNTSSPTYSKTSFVKYNPQGVVLWAEQLFNPNPATSKFFTDKGGNTTILTDFVGTITVLGKTYTDTAFTSNSPGTCFIHLNATGVVTSVRAKKIGQGYIEDMYAFDATHTLVVGEIHDPGGPSNLPLKNDTIDGFICPPGTFIALMDTAYKFTIYKRMGADTFYPYPHTYPYRGTIYEGQKSICVSANKSVYVHVFQSPAYLPDPTTFPLPPYPLPTDQIQVGSIGYIVKLDSNLNYKWATEIISSGRFGPIADNVGIMTTDKNDNVITLGLFSDSLFIDHQLYYTFHYYEDNSFIYVNKLNGNTGHIEWTQYTRSNYSRIWDICSDKLGNVYPMGNTVVGITFGNVTLAGNNLFVYKFKPDGSLAWGKTDSSKGGVYNNVITEDGRGNLYIAGNLLDTVSFGSTVLGSVKGATNYPQATDIFIAKLGNCAPSAPNVTASSALTWCGLDSVELSAPASQSYLWNTGDTMQTVTIKNSGSYSVFAIDSLGCYASSAAEHVFADPVLSLQTTTTPVSCYGYKNGSITLQVSGGTRPYLYNHQQTLPTLNNLSAGYYLIAVTDSAGCGITDTVFIKQPATALSVQLDTLKVGKGTAIANATGGTGPYTYLWNTVPTQTSDTAVNLVSGWYAVTVTDANGCQVTDSILIKNFNSVAPVNNSGWQVYPNPNNGQFTIMAGNAGTMYLQDITGRQVMQRSLKPGINNISVNLPAGIYQACIIANGNRWNEKIVITP